MQKIVLLILLFSSFLTMPIWGHGDLEEQIERISRRIENTPNNSSLYLERGQLYAQHLDYAAAKADLSKARQLDVQLGAQLQFVHQSLLGLYVGRKWVIDPVFCA